jgi:hypothetical protein
MSNSDLHAYYTPDPEIGLFGGRWVLDPVTRVQRWVQEREPKPMPSGPFPKVVRCGWCESDFIRTRSLVSYCSESCRYEARKKSHREFEATRRRASKRCTDCGTQITNRNAGPQRCKSCSLSRRDSEGKWAA